MIEVRNMKHPNGGNWTGDFLGYQAQVVEVLFDNSYDHGTGELLKPEMLGWTNIAGVIVMGQAWEYVDGIAAIVVPETATPIPGSVALRLYLSYEAIPDSKNAMVEAGQGDDFEGFTATLLVIGS